MGKHTPGRWKISINPISHEQSIIVADGGPRAGAIVGYVGGMGGPDSSFWPEPNYNARLIAAAPDLLAALDMVILHNGKLTGADCAQIHAAISRATS